MRWKMTKCEMVWPEIIPGFDALQMKQELQERVQRETEGMTTEEWIAHIRQGAKEFRAEIELIRAEKKAGLPIGDVPQFVGR